MGSETKRDSFEQFGRKFCGRFGRVENPQVSA